MSGAEMLQLRFHFGERDRYGDGPLEAAVIDACARRGVAAAVTLRGVEGFGAKQRLRTDRLLSLSEDAPLVVIAVGEPERIESLADEVRAMAGEGLMVLEPVVTDIVSPLAGEAETQSVDAGRPGRGEGLVRLPADAAKGRIRRPGRADERRVKATVWGPRRGPASPHLAAVDAFHRHGAEAATVLLGVDGVLEGERRRARFVASNRGVPAITVATGERSVIEAALADLAPSPSLVTFEAHGGVVARNRRIGTVSHHSGPGAGEKWGMEPPSRHSRVSLVTSEIAAHGAHPRYLALIRALREEGAAGATALRGVWGFRGGREPHGDRVLALRRDVPIVVEAVDTAERAERRRELALEFAGVDDVVDLQPIPRAITFE